MDLWKSWKLFGDLSPVLGDRGQHKVLAFPWYAKAPHGRRDICCGSMTWETSLLLQLPSPHTLLLQQLQVSWFCPHVLGCPSKGVKIVSKIIQILFALPFSAQLTHPPWLYFSWFPNQCCEWAGDCGADAALPAAGLDAPGIFGKL